MKNRIMALLLTLAITVTFMPSVFFQSAQEVNAAEGAFTVTYNANGHGTFTLGNGSNNKPYGGCSLTGKSILHTTQYNFDIIEEYDDDSSTDVDYFDLDDDASADAHVDPVPCRAAGDDDPQHVGYLSADAGWRFIGWFKGPEDGAEEYDFSKPFKSDVTLYAHWASEKFFYLTFDANLDEAKFTKGEGATDYSINDSKNRAYVKVLTDENNPDIEKYEISESKTSVAGKVTVYAPGYKFLGWFEGPEATCSKYNFKQNVADLTTNQTVYAHWDTLKSFNVYYHIGDNGEIADADGFEMIGGNTIATKTISSDAKTVTLGNPPLVRAKEGYEFDGWYTFDEGGSLVEAKFDENYTKRTDDLDVYAQWRPLKGFTVKYYAGENGKFVGTQGFTYFGSSIAIKDITSEAEKVYLGNAPEVTANPGWKFLGWYTEDGEEVDFGDNFTKQSEEVKIVAHWGEVGLDDEHEWDFEEANNIVPMFFGVFSVFTAEELVQEVFDNIEGLEGSESYEETIRLVDNLLKDGVIGLNATSDKYAAKCKDCDLEQEISIVSPTSVKYDGNNHGVSIKDENWKAKGLPKFKEYYLDIGKLFARAIAMDAPSSAGPLSEPELLYEIMLETGVIAPCISENEPTDPGLYVAMLFPAEGALSIEDIIEILDYEEAFTHTEGEVYPYAFFEIQGTGFNVNYHTNGHAEFQTSLSDDGYEFYNANRTSAKIYVDSSVKTVRVPELPETIMDVEDGYVFDGWYDDPVYGTEYNFSTEKSLSETDVNIYAHWKKLAGFTVRYHANGKGHFEKEDGYDEYELYDNDRVAQKFISSEATKAKVPEEVKEDSENIRLCADKGQRFLYWTADTTGITPFEFADEYDKDIDLYAVWADSHEFVVKYHAGAHGKFVKNMMTGSDYEFFNDFTQVQKDISLDEAEVHIEELGTTQMSFWAYGVKLMAQAGWEFTGWYTAETGGEAFDFGVDQSSRGPIELNVYAQWKQADKKLTSWNYEEHDRANGTRYMLDTAGNLVGFNNEPIFTDYGKVFNSAADMLFNDGDTYTETVFKKIADMDNEEFKSNAETNNKQLNTLRATLKSDSKVKASLTLTTENVNYTGKAYTAYNVDASNWLDESLMAFDLEPYFINYSDIQKLYGELLEKSTSSDAQTFINDNKMKDLCNMATQTAPTEVGKYVAVLLPKEEAMQDYRTAYHMNAEKFDEEFYLNILPILPASFFVIENAETNFNLIYHVGEHGKFTVQEDSKFKKDGEDVKTVVTSDADEVYLEDLEIKKGENTGLKVTLEAKPGYEFDGWYTVADDGTETKVKFDEDNYYGTTGSVDLYAKWTPKAHEWTYKNKSDVEAGDWNIAGMFGLVSDDLAIDSSTKAENPKFYTLEEFKNKNNIDNYNTVTASCDCGESYSMTISSNNVKFGETGKATVTGNWPLDKGLDEYVIKYFNYDKIENYWKFLYTNGSEFNPKTELTSTSFQSAHAATTTEPTESGKYIALLLPKKLNNDEAVNYLYSQKFFSIPEFALLKGSMPDVDQAAAATFFVIENATTDFTVTYHTCEHGTFTLSKGSKYYLEGNGDITKHIYSDEAEVKLDDLAISDNAEYKAKFEAEAGYEFAGWWTQEKNGTWVDLSEQPYYKTTGHVDLYAHWTVKPHTWEYKYKTEDVVGKDFNVLGALGLISWDYEEPTDFHNGEDGQDYDKRQEYTLSDFAYLNENFDKYDTVKASCPEYPVKPTYKLSVNNAVYGKDKVVATKTPTNWDLETGLDEYVIKYFNYDKIEEYWTNNGESFNYKKTPKNNIEFGKAHAVLDEAPTAVGRYIALLVPAKVAEVKGNVVKYLYPNDWYDNEKDQACAVRFFAISKVHTEFTVNYHPNKRGTFTTAEGSKYEVYRGVASRKITSDADVVHLDNVLDGNNESLGLVFTPDEGYVFDGWWTQAEGGEEVRYNKDNFFDHQGDLDLYAHWIEKPHDWSYKYKNGTEAHDFDIMRELIGAGGLEDPGYKRAFYTLDEFAVLNDINSFDAIVASCDCGKVVKITDFKVENKAYDPEVPVKVSYNDTEWTEKGLEQYTVKYFDYSKVEEIYKAESEYLGSEPGAKAKLEALLPLTGAPVEVGKYIALLVPKKLNNTEVCRYLFDNDHIFGLANEDAPCAVSFFVISPNQETCKHKWEYNGRTGIQGDALARVYKEFLNEYGVEGLYLLADMLVDFGGDDDTGYVPIDGIMSTFINALGSLQDVVKDKESPAKLLAIKEALTFERFDALADNLNLYTNKITARCSVCGKVHYLKTVAPSSTYTGKAKAITFDESKWDKSCHKTEDTMTYYIDVERLIEVIAKNIQAAQIADWLGESENPFIQIKLTEMVAGSMLDMFTACSTTAPTKQGKYIAFTTFVYEDGSVSDMDKFVEALEAVINLTDDTEDSDNVVNALLESLTSLNNIAITRFSIQGTTPQPDPDDPDDPDEPDKPSGGGGGGGGGSSSEEVKPTTDKTFERDVQPLIDIILERVPNELTREDEPKVISARETLNKALAIVAELEKYGKLTEAQKKTITDVEHNVVLAERKLVVMKDKVEGLKLTAGEKKITVKWNLLNNEYLEGYRVYRSTKKHGTYKRVYTTTDLTIHKRTNKHLKSGKKYYYRVRGFAVIGGQTVYTHYSAVKKATTKKDNNSYYYYYYY